MFHHMYYNTLADFLASTAAPVLYSYHISQVWCPFVSFPQTLLWLSISCSEVSKGLTMLPRPEISCPFPFPSLTSFILSSLLFSSLTSFLAVAQLRQVAEHVSPWRPYHVLFPLPATSCPWNLSCSLLFL